MSELDNLFNEFYLLRMELNKLNLTTHDLLRLVPNLKLDWGIGNEAFLNDFNSGTTTPLILSATLDYSRNINKSLFQKNKIAGVLFDNFILRKRKLEIQNLINTHCLLIENGGKFRKASTQITKGHALIAPPISNPINIHPELVELLGWYNKEIQNNATHPLFLSAIFHYRLVKIHPFRDGNGRLCRVMSSLILLSFNIPPPICKREDRLAYIACLRDADYRDYRPLLFFIGNKVLTSMRHIVSLNTIAAV